MAQGLLDKQSSDAGQGKVEMANSTLNVRKGEIYA